MSQTSPFRLGIALLVNRADCPLDTIGIEVDREAGGLEQRRDEGHTLRSSAVVKRS